MANDIRFILNGALRRVAGVAPTRTLLDWLREDAGLIGTKEGCNEGDCGACTVAVRRLGDPGAAYRAINACIRFLPTLHGYELVTVDHLASTGKLHPIQKEFAERHASQCGFCTPGFVMSAFAAGPDGANDLAALNDLYAGNLCRCTGYGPILEATREARAGDWPALPGPTPEAVACADISADESPYRYEACGQRFFAPRTVDQLAELAETYPDAAILAGSTDVGLWVTKLGRPLDTLISIDRIDGFDAVDTTGDTITIGAGASYTDAWSALGDYYPDIAELIRRIGSVQVRNAGTIGGNIANGSPIGDTPPALIAAGATLVLRSAHMERRLPLENYFLAYGKQDRGPGEVVARIEVPKPTDPQALRCYKLSKRFDQDISAICAAINLEVRDGMVQSARIAFGGMAATPKRAGAAEAILSGQSFTEDAVRNAMAALDEDFAPITDMRASADYRKRAAKNLLFKYYVERTKPQIATRLVGRGAAVPLPAAE